MERQGKVLTDPERKSVYLKDFYDRPLDACDVSFLIGALKRALESIATNAPPSV